MSHETSKMDYEKMAQGCTPGATFYKHPEHPMGYSGNDAAQLGKMLRRSPGGADSQPMAESHVGSELTRTENLARRLEKQLEELGDRLSYVLSPPCTQACGNTEDSDHTPRSGLTEQIFLLNIRFDALLSRLDKIIERIEV